MNPSRIFIERPVATTLLMLAVVLSGLIAYRLLPISALPQVDYPTIQVSTLYPGASPDVVASSITAPLERQFGQMPGLARMSSTSSGGASTITLRFGLDLTLDVAEQEVQAAINAASNLLPTDLPMPPVYSKVNPADAPVLTLGVSSTVLPLPKVEDLVDTRLAQKLSQVPGVGLVTLAGGQRPAVRVQADPVALAAQGLTLEDLRTAIGQQNVNQAKGSFDGPLRASTIDANDQLKSADEYRQLVVAYRNGAPIRLGDVARTVDGAENSRLAAWADAKPAIVINIQRQPGANVVGTVDRLQALLPSLSASLPASITIQPLTDRTVTIRASVDDVQFELALAVGLVVLVIFLFLRSARATLIPAVAVPVSLVGTFGVMQMAGFSINNLSLMAMVIATGFVVDDAIVVVENIFRHLGMNKTPRQAALDGAGEIGFTIISLTVSLIAVLIPLLFMADVVGRLFREFAITLAVAIAISAVVSLTLTPMMSARLLRPEKHDERHDEQGGRLFRRVLAGYERSLGWVLDHAGLTLVVALATLAVTVGLYLWIPKGFFPVQDTGVIQGITEASPTVSFDEMARRQQAVAAQVLKDPAVASLSSFIGVDGTNPTLNRGRMLINLKPRADRDLDAVGVARRLDDALHGDPSMRLYLQPVQDLTVEDSVSATQYQFVITSADAGDLQTANDQLLAKLRSEPTMSGVTSDLATTGLQAFLNIDRDAAARLGVSASAIDQALYDAFGQRLISTLFTQTNQYRVVLESAGDRGPQALDSLYVPGVLNGVSTPVRLSSVVRLDERAASLAVRHEGQFPAATISFNLAPGASLGDAVDAIQHAQHALHLPASVQTHFEGAALAYQASLANTLWLVLAAVVVMYIVLGVLYESFVHPATILSTLPSAAVGALLALMLGGQDLGIVGVIGIVLLIGIVKKNAIMMIDFALQARREQGLPAREAIRQACLLRLRPILMTTMAALFGALPLMLGTGVGSELRHPLGLAMVGGLLFSQVLTLFTTPVIYLAFERLAERRASPRVAPA